MPRLKVFLSEVRGVVPRSVLMYSDHGHTQEARTELLRIVPNATLTTPKPTRLIRRLLEIGSDKDSLIMDSFAGSGTTAQAAWQLNKTDGGLVHSKNINFSVPHRQSCQNHNEFS